MRAGNYNFYHNLGYWFIFSIVLIVGGFFQTYFSVFTQLKNPVIHTHFALMVLWVSLFIIQPFLVKYKKTSLHRRIGRVSYILMPLVALSAFLMMRHGYFTFTAYLEQQNLNGLATYSSAEILHEAARNNALPFVYWFWLLLFYSLAIIHRRRSSIHARYMLATGLTILGPTVDRILFFIFKMKALPFNIPLESFAFILADSILLILLWQDIRLKRNLKPLLTSLAGYGIVQILYFRCRDSMLWEGFMTWMMRG